MQPLVAAIRQLLDRIATLSNAAGTLVVLALVAIVNYDVIARGIFSKPFMGAVELVQFSLVLIVFLQLPDVVRVDRLTRSDGFLLIADKRWPRLARAIRRAINLLAAAFMAIACYAAWPEFIEMWESNDFFGVPGVFTAPWWPLKLVILVSTGLCALLFLSKLQAPTDRGSDASR